MMKLRMITGSIIAIHGLLRIIFIDQYIEFVHQNYLELLPQETLLTVGAALLPFLEFFVGLIITFMGSKRSLFAGFLISLFMGSFIVVGHLYPRLIYHGIVVVLLATVYFYQNNSHRKRRIIL